jgi:hypothetical protein
MNLTSPLPHSQPVQNTVIVSVQPQSQRQVPPVIKQPLFSSGTRKRVSRHQTGQNHDIQIANRCFENVAQFRYFGNGYNKWKPDSGGN